jgi:hypothetical protein
MSEKRVTIIGATLGALSGKPPRGLRMRCAVCDREAAAKQCVQILWLQWVHAKLGRKKGRFPSAPAAPLRTRPKSCRAQSTISYGASTPSQRCSDA